MKLSCKQSKQRHESFVWKDVTIHCESRKDCYWPDRFAGRSHHPLVETTGCQHRILANTSTRRLLPSKRDETKQEEKEYVMVMNRWTVNKRSTISKQTDSQWLNAAADEQQNRRRVHLSSGIVWSATINALFGFHSSSLNSIPVNRNSSLFSPFVRMLRIRSFSLEILLIFNFFLFSCKRSRCSCRLFNRVEGTDDGTIDACFDSLSSSSGCWSDSSSSSSFCTTTFFSFRFCISLTSLSWCSFFHFS